MKLCPCDSGHPYLNCCGQFISGELSAPTPEALMRSRYTAYTQANIDYIERTMKGRALEGFDRQRSALWASQVAWLGLEVVKASEKFPLGWVEFKAYFLQDNQKQILHEKSEFVFEAGAWYYTNGITLPERLAKATKTGRNDPCPCGSQKKFKKCCGVA